MIPKSSKLSVIDNSGDTHSFLHPAYPWSYRCRYAFIKDVIVVPVKKLRNKQKFFQK
jgi:ribosomal protein L14